MLLSNTGTLVAHMISTNCAEHQSNTRHVQEKYDLYARTLKQAILCRYPIVRVTCKPISNSVEDFQKAIVAHKSKGDQRDLIIENHRPEMRIGAFEVQLFTREKNEVKMEVLHSKLESRVWPNIGSVLGKIGKICEHHYSQMHPSYKYQCSNIYNIK